MRLKVPVIAVVGRKKTGKTTVVENIVSKLVENDYKVATAKHVYEKGFSMDVEGKDTWRHTKAGANPVISVSDAEKGVLIQNGISHLSIDELLSLTPEVNVLILEGFSQIILTDKQVGKIVCLRDENEYEEWKHKTRGEIIAFCAFQPLKKTILKIEEDSILVTRALEYIEKERTLLMIFRSLPGLNCNKCGYSSCDEMARAIYDGNMKLTDCAPLVLRSKLKTEILVDDKEVPIQSFVSEIIRNSVLGMIHTLKGVSLQGDEKLRIEVSRK